LKVLLLLGFGENYFSPFARSSEEMAGVQGFDHKTKNAFIGNLFDQHPPRLAAFVQVLLTVYSFTPSKLFQASDGILNMGESKLKFTGDHIHMPFSDLIGYITKVQEVNHQTRCSVKYKCQSFKYVFTLNSRICYKLYIMQ